MAVDLVSLPAWAIGGLLVVMALAGLLDRRRVAKLIERWSWTRAMVKIVREQRRMAKLALQPGTELRHSASDGSELVIRRTAMPEAEQGE